MYINRIDFFYFVYIKRISQKQLYLSKLQLLKSANKKVHVLYIQKANKIAKRLYIHKANHFSKSNTICVTFYVQKAWYLTLCDFLWKFWYLHWYTKSMTLSVTWSCYIEERDMWRYQNRDTLLSATLRWKFYIVRGAVTF